MALNRSKNFKQYDYTSRYESFPYYYDDYNNRYYYGLTANLSKDTPYAAYVVKPGDTYDSIAYDTYGSPLFYWAICYFNDISDSLKEPTVGITLKIPTISSITFED